MTYEAYDRTGVFKKAKFYKGGYYTFTNFAPSRPYNTFMFRALGWEPFDARMQIYPGIRPYRRKLFRVKKSITITGTIRDASTKKIIKNTKNAYFKVRLRTWVRAYVKNGRFTFKYIPVNTYFYQLYSIRGYQL